MFTRREKYLLRDNIRRSMSLKYKYINFLQKSLFHNRNILKKKRILIFYKICTRTLNSKKLKNICMLSGEPDSVNKKLLFTRFQINYNSILNKLQNFKLDSW